jgi:hypothetical protein
MRESSKARRPSFIVSIFLLCCFCRAFGQEHDAASKKTSWRFAVSGDSRNCGDVVMPAIASKVRQDGVSFYWHLGDFRAIYDFDEDYRQLNPKSTIIDYENKAWPDFIQQQLQPFRDLPVYLGLGNHETISPKTRADAIQQFADWFETPLLKEQRLNDDPSDHRLKAYYHWIIKGVDFITLDNSTDDQFDDAQMKWFNAEIDRAEHNPEIRTVVLGMHKALPDSLSTGHSMNESAQGSNSGRAVYQRMLELKEKHQKNVYVLASHSHFYLEDIYNTACRKPNPQTILPGWIVGTAGAVRYRLPDGIEKSPKAVLDTYGYLLAEVAPDATISFRFRRIEQNDVPPDTITRYGDALVTSCFTGNQSSYVPAGPPQPPRCP